MAATKTFGDIGVDYGDENYSYIGGNMADRWVVASPWNTVNSWSTAEGGAPGAAVPTSSDNAWLSDTSFAGAFTIDVNSVCLNLATTLVVTGGTDNYTDVIDLQTYNLTVSGFTTIGSGATLTMGSSAGTGLITTGLTFNEGSAFDLQTDSLIVNSGNYSCHDSAIFTNNNRGDYTQSDNGGYTSVNSNNVWYNFTLNVTKIFTALANPINVTNINSNNTTINGIMDLNGFNILLGGSGTITLGTNSDFVGVSVIFWSVLNTATYTNNKVGAFSLTGICRIYLSANTLALTGDWSNANYEIQTISAVARNAHFASGTLKAIDFTITNSSSGNITVINATNSFELSGNVDLHAGAGAYTTIWTKGTGTITLPGGPANIALDGQPVEDIIVDSTAAKTLTENAGTCDTLTINKSDPASELDMTTFNLTSAGLTTVTGTLTMGTSAGTGLTTVGLTFAAGSVRDLAIDSIINNSGNYSTPNADISTLNESGDYTQTANGSIDTQYAYNASYKFTNNEGVIATLTGPLNYITYITSHTFINNGTIALGVNSIYFGASNTVTFGANSDFTGSGDIGVFVPNTANYTNSKASAFSFTGTVIISLISTDFLSLTGDWSNANYEIKVSRVVARSTQFTPGTLKCIDFSVSNASTGPVTVDNATNNATLVISGNIDLNVGSFTTVWQKGTNTITLTGAAGTHSIDFNGLSVENITHNHAGAIKEYAANVITATCTFSNGIVRSTVADTLRTITVTNTSVAANTTFKDISMGSANKVNAKAATNTNLGNTPGIVFVDLLQPSLMGF